MSGLHPIPVGVEDDPDSHAERGNAVPVRCEVRHALGRPVASGEARGGRLPRSLRIAPVREIPHPRRADPPRALPAPVARLGPARVGPRPPS